MSRGSALTKKLIIRKVLLDKIIIVFSLSALLKIYECLCLLVIPINIWGNKISTLKPTFFTKFLVIVYPII